MASLSSFTALCSNIIATAAPATQAKPIG